MIPRNTLAYNIRSIELAATVDVTGGIKMKDSIPFRKSIDWMLENDNISPELFEHIIDMAIYRNYKSFNAEKQIEQYQRNIAR